MDSSEFAIWAKRLKILFPKFSDWISGTDAAHRAEVSAEWERALSRVEFVDAMAALTDIHSGEAEAFNQWEYGTWVAHVSKLARAKREHREKSERSSEPKRCEEAPEHRINLGGVYRQILAIRDAGGDTAEALNRLLPIDVRSGPRFRCRQCQDSGFVSVWHAVTMRAVEKGDELTPRLLKTMSTICNCELGRAKITPPGAKRIDWTEGHLYDESKHCLCLHGAACPEAIDELVEFVASLPRRQLESMPSFSPVLAGYSLTVP